MEGIPQELVIVGGVGLVILAALVLVKFGKQILTVLLVVGGLAVVMLIGWALLQRPDVIPDDTAETVGDVADIVRFLTPKDEPAASAPVYSTPAPGGGFVSGLLVALLVVALGVGGYFWIRWKLAERSRQRAATRQRPTRRQPQPQKPPWAQWEWPDVPPTIYNLDGYQDNCGQDDGLPDPAVWGWE